MDWGGSENEFADRRGRAYFGGKEKEEKDVLRRGEKPRPVTRGYQPTTDSGKASSPGAGEEDPSCERQGGKKIGITHNTAPANQKKKSPAEGKKLWRGPSPPCKRRRKRTLKAAIGKPPKEKSTMKGEVGFQGEGEFFYKRSKVRPFKKLDTETNQGELRFRHKTFGGSEFFLQKKKKRRKSSTSGGPKPGGKKKSSRGKTCKVWGKKKKTLCKMSGLLSGEGGPRSESPGREASSSGGKRPT